MLLIILCGIPCSGKSQVAAKVAKELEINHRFDAIVVDPDKIREMIPALAEGFDPERESFVNSLALILIEESLKRHNIVISDDLNYYESTRHKLIQAARKYKAKYIIVYLTVTAQVAQKRNAARGTPVPQEVIMDIDKKFDQPGAKYKWDRPALIVDSEKVDPEEAAKQVLQVALSKVGGGRPSDQVSASSYKSAQGGKRVQQPSFKKDLDEATRRILRELFSSWKLDPRVSKDASRLRRTFLIEMSKKPIDIKDAESEFKSRVMTLMRRRTQSVSSRPQSQRD
nr:AAA family ATPase [Candidatus Njordarchaeota archaeon]